VTRVGALELPAPQDRLGRFSTEPFERHQGSDKALVGTVAEMSVPGVPTRKVKAVSEALCGHSFSASAIGAINKSLDAGLKAFAKRRLNKSYPCLTLDARYENVREGVIPGSSQVKPGDQPAVLVAVAVASPSERPRRRVAELFLRRRQRHTLPPHLLDDFLGALVAVARQFRGFAGERF
jgi:putative transposase